MSVKPGLPARWHLACLFLVLAVSAYLRFRGLVFQSYWNDELATIVLADPDRSLFDVIYSSLQDKSPPLYQSTLWAWFRLFGFTEYAGRSLSAIAGTLAVPAMYFMAREYTDKETALYATIITGLNTYLVFYSQEVRAYSFFFLEAVLAMLFLSRLARDSNITNLLLFSFFTICLVSTHYYGLLLYMAMLGFLVFFKSFSKQFHNLPDRYLYFNAAITFVFLMPVVPFMLMNALDKTNWIKTPRPDFLISFFTDYFGSTLISSLYAILFFIGLVFLFKQEKLHSRYMAWLAAFILLFIYLLPYIRSLVSTPMLINRYTIGALPFVILIIAAGVTGLKYNKLKSLLLVLLVILNARFLLYDQAYYSSVKKQQFREVIQHIIAAGGTGPMFSCDDERAQAYFKMLGHPALVNDEDRLFIQLAAKTPPDRFWYIGSTCCGCQDSTETINHYRDSGRFNMLDRLDRKKAFVYLMSARELPAVPDR